MKTYSRLRKSIIPQRKPLSDVTNIPKQSTKIVSRMQSNEKEVTAVPAKKPLNSFIAAVDSVLEEISNQPLANNSFLEKTMVVKDALDLSIDRILNENLLPEETAEQNEMEEICLVRKHKKRRKKICMPRRPRKKLTPAKKEETVKDDSSNGKKSPPSKIGTKFFQKKQVWIRKNEPKC